MENTDQRRQAQEPWVGFHQHPLDLIDFCVTRPALLRCGLIESMCHACKDLEFEICHRLEDNLQGQGRCSAVDLNILRAEAPEVIREDNWKVVALRSRYIPLARNKMYI